ncbi:MAG: ABC-type spermidine/putrescine transport system permease subunit I [Planctomycetaceae bacterium]|jgi:ABC-type spermidine/putrescine transport system permease subunit I
MKFRRHWLFAFGGVLVVKLLTEAAGKYGENCYLTGSAVVAAIMTSACVAVSFPLARLLIVERNRPAQIAVCVAVFLTTMFGCWHLQFSN